MTDQQKTDLLDYIKAVKELERAKQKREDLKDDYIARYRVYGNGDKVIDIWGTGGDCVVCSAVMDSASGKIGYNVFNNSGHQFYREFEQIKPREQA